MSDPSSAEVLRELHGDLRRKYQQHGAAVERIWRSLDKKQRTECLKVGVAEGSLLKHSMDRSLGNVYKFVPEMNERDITAPESENLLEILRHRATKTLVEQYFEGCSVTYGRGDIEFIEEMMQTRNLRLNKPYKDCFSLFLDDETYGVGYHVKEDVPDFLQKMGMAVASKQLVPQATGELVIMRQISLIQHLNILIGDILEADPQRRRVEPKKNRPKKPKQAAVSAHSQLTFRAAPAKPTLADLVASAQEQQADLADYVQLLSSEPEALEYAVNTWFFSQPGLVPDDKGRVLPVHTDKHTSGCVLDVVREAIQAAATWRYLGQLLALLETDGAGGQDKTCRELVLQELANTCQAEFQRTQALLKRQVQLGSGAKRFRRVAGPSSAQGQGPKVTVRGDPAELTRSDPQLHYLLRLCQGDSAAATPALALDWMKMLNDLHSTHPEERDRLMEREVDALGDLAVIVGFVQALAQSPAVSLPPFSRPKKNKNKDQRYGQAWTRRAQALATELAAVRTQVDLRDHVVPLDHLLVPGVAAQALRSLDQQVEAATGSRLGFLYEDLVDDCLEELAEQFRQLQAARAAKAQEAPTPAPAPAVQPVPATEETSEARVAQRKQKKKTRPAAVSAYEMVPQEPAKELEASTAAAPVRVSVSAASADVFTSLFARGSVSWAAFESAMADAGFAVLPKFGSVYTFSSSTDAPGQKSITLHRPHGAKIEGYRSLLVARRLQRRLGWTTGSFQVKDGD